MLNQHCWCICIHACLPPGWFNTAADAFSHQPAEDEPEPDGEDVECDGSVAISQARHSPRPRSSGRSGRAL